MWHSRVYTVQPIVEPVSDMEAADRMVLMKESKMARKLEQVRETWDCSCLFTLNSRCLPPISYLWHWKCANDSIQPLILAPWLLPPDSSPLTPAGEGVLARLPAVGGEGRSKNRAEEGVCVQRWGGWGEWDGGVCQGQAKVGQVHQSEMVVCVRVRPR